MERTLESKSRDLRSSLGSDTGWLCDLGPQLRTDKCQNVEVKGKEWMI